MRLKSLPQQHSDKWLDIFELTMASALALSAIFGIFSMFSVPLLPFEISSDIGGSLIFIWNSIADTLGNTDYYLLPKFETETSSSGTVFIFAFVSLSVLNYLIIKAGKPIFLIIYVILFLFIPIVWNIVPSVKSYVAVICMMVLTYSYTAVINYFNRKTLVGMLLILAVTTIFVIAISPDGYTKPDVAINADRLLGNISYKIRFGGTLLGGENLCELENRKKTETKALKVTMTEPDSLYLRGFIGSRLTERGWSRLDNSSYYGGQALYYWLNKYGFSGLKQLDYVNRITGGEADENQIKIKNIGTDRNHLYIPYEVIDFAELDGLNYSDEFIGNDKFWGSSEYGYIASQNLVKNWPDLAAGIFTEENNDELTKYKLLESYFNVDSYEKYTTISSEHTELMKTELGNTGDSTRAHIDYKHAIQIVRSYLEEQIVYTETINSTGEEDFIEAFIQKKKGYDVHYASAATVMFRYYGIPARYVEGYLITPDDVEAKLDGSTMEITDKNLHAWAEIYVDSLGWTPLEVTPEYYGVMEDPDLTTGLENISATDVKNDNEKTSPEEEEMKKESAENEKLFPWRLLLIITISAILIIALIATFRIIIRKIIQTVKRRKAFNQSDVRKAVCAIYSYMLENHIITDGEIDEIGEKAAYSLHEVKESDRIRIMEYLKTVKGNK